jgi:hypothetical protein
MKSEQFSFKAVIGKSVVIKNGLVRTIARVMFPAKNEEFLVVRAAQGTAIIHYSEIVDIIT